MKNEQTYSSHDFLQITIGLHGIDNVENHIEESIRLIDMYSTLSLPRVVIPDLGQVGISCQLLATENPIQNKNSENKIAVTENKVIVINKEVLCGAINGRNRKFSLQHQLVPGSEHFFLNGRLQSFWIDYQVTDGCIITNSAPEPGDQLRISYHATV